MSKTYTILGCSGIFWAIVLFGTYSLGSGKIMSFCTLGQGKSIIFSQKAVVHVHTLTLNSCVQFFERNQLVISLKDLQSNMPDFEL